MRLCFEYLVFVVYSTRIKLFKKKKEERNGRGKKGENDRYREMGTEKNILK